MFTRWAWVHRVNTVMEKMSTDTATKTRQKIQPNLDLVPPPRYQVIFMNDNVTTMDFVVALLMQLFEHTEDTAQLLMIKIHEQGQAVVAVLPFEIAESKAVEATILARNNNFPLNIKIEPEA
jgi:ATP-dependent Clp protease adaptor protein ClpS